MSGPLSTIERAFQLARGGTCQSVDDVRRTLKAERFDSVDAHLRGSLQKQIAAALYARHKEIAR